MVAQVLAYARQGMAHLDAEIAQPLGLADARQFEQLRRVDRAAADDDFARRARPRAGRADRVADAGAALAVEQRALGQRAGLDMQVLARLRIGSR